MDLKNPKLKMSKSSANPDGYISLWDDQQTIFKKIKSATTDSYNEIKYRPQEQPGVTNLITIYSLFSAQNPSITIEQFQKNNINNYLLLKQVVAQIIYQKLKVIQDNIIIQNKKPQKIAEIIQKAFTPSSAIKKLVQRNIQPLLAKIGLNYQEL